MPAADFSTDELLYLPRNVRAHRLYGMSPVEQIALTVNIALRRDAATLDYYRAGSTPDAFATLPKEWTIDQIRQFQDYFDALMSGNSARRRMTKFMPADFRLIEARQPPLKGRYNEWLTRVICYAFSVPASIGPAGTGFGNIVKGSLRGPGNSVWHAALARSFPLAGERSLQFRAEYFNILNHTLLNNPNTSTPIASSTSFGTITSTGDPRIAQFALKFVF